MEKEENIEITEEQMIAKGLINVLALGYRGIELWREKRIPPEVKVKSDEKEA